MGGGGVDSQGRCADLRPEGASALGHQRHCARHLLSRLDVNKGAEIRGRALDSGSLGVALQSANRQAADDEGYVEPHLWTGVGLARSGCGAALVGSVDQVLSEIHDYMKMGIRAFIFSGYPHLQECEHLWHQGAAAAQNGIVAPCLRAGSSPNADHAAGRAALITGAVCHAKSVLAQGAQPEPDRLRGLAHVERKASKCRWTGKLGSSSMSSPWATRSPKSWA